MSTNPLRIMVVDDEEFVRSLLSEVLRTLGHDPVVFGEAAPAIEAFRAAAGGPGKFDIALLDLRLPGGMDGVALLHELRKISGDVKALAISGRAEEHATVPLGFQGFLAKPFRIKALSEAIVAALGGGAPPG